MEINGPQMAAAMVERPIGTLSDRVGQLLRARCFGVTAAQEVCAEIKALGHEDAALRFWRALGGYRTDDALVVEIVNAVRAFEVDKPVPAERSQPPASYPAWPLDVDKVDPLSRHLEETYRLPAPR